MEVSSQRPGGARRVEPLLLALSLLTLVTGLVDAACYLGLGRVFTANMTGNVVLLAFGAAGAQGLPVLATTVSLVVFLAGAAAGGRLAHRLVGPAGAPMPAPVRRRWVTVALLAELGLVVVAGVVAVGLAVDAGGARRYVVIGLLAAGLGLQNATVRRLAAVGLMFAGALVGALLLRVDVALPVLVAAVVIALAAVALRLETEEPLPQAGA